MTRVSDALDRVKVTFDDLVADVGLLLVATLSQRLGPEALVNATLCLVGRVGGERPGRKILTLVNATCVSASHSDHTDRLWASASGSVMGHRVMALSTIGTLLRAFTFGHCRQMKAVVGHTLQRACALGAGPGVKPLAIDIDSTICEVNGHDKAGTAFGYTGRLGYHPHVATRADSGEVLYARMRKGSANTQRGTVRFLDDLIAGVRRGGASCELTVHVDSGFWSNDTITALNRLNVRHTMA